MYAHGGGMAVPPGHGAGRVASTVCYSDRPWRQGHSHGQPPGLLNGAWRWAVTWWCGGVCAFVCVCVFVVCGVNGVTCLSGSDPSLFFYLLCFSASL